MTPCIPFSLRAKVRPRERQVMKIAYATCDFAAMRREGVFYVDKTHYIPKLESRSGNYLIFLRPRRFGKSTWLSTLEKYYDIALAGEFDELFGGLWIHQHPTPEKNKYLILHLDFSPVASEGTEAEIQRSFSHQVKSRIWGFIQRYAKLIPNLALLEPLVAPTIGVHDDDMATLMGHLFTIASSANHKIYLFIDEYDHFGNRLISDGMLDTYQSIVRSAGFLRSFYASLKAFTSNRTLARMFITGVSPIMLDDLSSGFNIVTHISSDDEFNGLAGFTTADVERGVDMLLADRPELQKEPRIGNRENLLETLKRYYDGYRFSKRATENIYNSTLVIYFLGKLLANGYWPDQMLDLNVRTDYGRLYAIAKATSGEERGTRELLEEILTRESIGGTLVEQFGTKLKFGHAQIVSLFFYMGMLTFAPDAGKSDEAKFVIPNRVMRELQWDYMAMALAEHDGLRVDASHIVTAMIDMAVHGDIEPLLGVFRKHVLTRISNRDLRGFNEKTMKLMLFSYLASSNSFYLLSEIEANQGYCDLLLALKGSGSTSKYAWIIEAKYVKAKATKREIEKAVTEGFAQIEKYAADKDMVQMLTKGKFLKAGVLVFVGTKDVRFWNWEKAA